MGARRDPNSRRGVQEGVLRAPFPTAREKTYGPRRKEGKRPKQEHTVHFCFVLYLIIFVCYNLSFENCLRCYLTVCAVAETYLLRCVLSNGMSTEEVGLDDISTQQWSFIVLIVCCALVRLNLLESYARCGVE